MRCGVRQVKLVVIVAVLGLLAFPAKAADYGVFIDVQTPEDLLDLLQAEEIDEDTYETLVELLEERVDITSADRDTLYALPNLTYQDVDAIIAYRQQAGTISDLDALVEAGVLSREKLDAILPFLLTPGAKRARAFHGRLRYKTLYLVGEERVPGMLFMANAGAFKGLHAGVLGVLTRNRVSDVRYDPGRDALSAKSPSPQFNVPKFFVEWEDEQWHAVAGTYRIGFGERLTFDNTGEKTPNGIRPDETIYYVRDLDLACRESKGSELSESPCKDARDYESPDFKWVERLRGAAIGAKRLAAGVGWFQTYAWGSYQTRSIYQYELYDEGKCPDPRDDDDPNCKAPPVFKRLSNLNAPAPELAYQTLPDMYNEWLAGANVTYFFDPRTKVGVTGYGAGVKWLVSGIDLDFQEWSRTPYGGPFGAIGALASWGYEWADLGLEVARSMDSQPAGGGFAGILRLTASFKKQELEASLRYYDKSYANPYARPVSEPDEFEGLRARDEAGARVSYAGSLGPLSLRGLADVWLTPSDRTPMLRLRARGDLKLFHVFQPGLYIEFQDRDLRSSGRGACYEVEQEIAGEPVPCTGERVLVGAQFRIQPIHPLVLNLKYQHKFVDDPKFKATFRQDSRAYLTVAYRPMPDLSLRAQVRYLNEDLTSATYLEDSLWSYLEAAWSWRRNLMLGLRYELYALLDDRDSTNARSPNPAHILRLEADWRF